MYLSWGKTKAGSNNIYGMSVETLIKEFTKLSEAEKARFLELLLNIDDEILPEWKAEVEKRWKAFENGEIAPLDGPEAERQLARKHGLSL